MIKKIVYSCILFSVSLHSSDQKIDKLKITMPKTTLESLPSTKAQPIIYYRNSTLLKIFNKQKYHALGQDLLSGTTLRIVTAIKNGADIDYQDKNGDTALHLAAYRRNVVQTEIILGAGANVAIKNNANMTPYDIQQMNQLQNGCINLLDLC